MKNIIKRVIIGVLIGVVLMLIKSCNVKAITNDIIGTTISETGMFLSLNSNNQTTQRGYSLIKGSDLYYALPSGQPFTYGTYGGSITQCDIPVVKDNFYSLTYYFISNDTYSFHPDYSSFGYKVGVNSTWLNTIPNFNLTSQSGSNQFACISGFYSPFGDCISSFTGIFKAPSNNTCVTMAFSSANHIVTTTEVAFVGYTYESLGNEPLTEQQITNVITTANQQVINNIINSTTSINNNSNNNRDLIIQNQNQNNQSLINQLIAGTNATIEANKVCKSYDKNDIYSSNSYLSSNGTIYSSELWGITNYIKLSNGSSITINSPISNNSVYYCFYGNDKSVISCSSMSNFINNLTIPNNADYIRVSIHSNYNVPQFTICKDGNQALTETQEQTNQTLTNIENSITDESGPTLGTLNNSAGWLPAGPVDSILNLPLSLLNNLTTSLGNSCTPAELDVPLVDSTIILPCMTDVYQEIGISAWVTGIGIIASAFILFSYLAKLYKWVDDTLTFRENNHIDNWGGV